MLLFVVTTIFIIFVYFFLRYFLSSTPNIAGTHIVITGGSSGIGKCIAIEAVRRGANVTILARDKDKLELAQTEIYHHVVNKERQTVQYFSVDLSQNYAEVEKAVDQAVQRLGSVFMLINCAGNAVSLRFEETPIPEFQRMLDVNYVSSVYATKAVLPSMKSMGGGHIMFTSSQAGLLGVYGYTAYSASKFALRGLAETLAMELRPYNIKVTMGYPPDTDTPGFEQEEKSKPLETKLISASCGLISPAVVGKKLFADTLQGKFMSSVGFEGFIICMLCCGMSPVSSYLDFILQICCMGPLRFTTAFIHKKFNQIIDKCFQDRMASKKET